MQKQEKLAFENQGEWNEWVKRVSNLPFRAEIISKDGTEASMKVSSVKIIKDGKEEILIEDEIELKTKSAFGDEINQSKAIFIAPQHGGKPRVITHGNASVFNKRSCKILLF